MEFFRVVNSAATVLEVMRISASGLQVTACTVCYFGFILLVWFFAIAFCCQHQCKWFAWKDSSPKRPL